MRNLILVFILSAFSCAPPPPARKRVVEESPGIKTTKITEEPVRVETVYVTLVETVVETVEVIKEVPIERTLHPTVVPEATPKARVYKVQVGAFLEEADATELYNLLKVEYGDLVYIEYIPPYWKVRIGNYGSWTDALRVRNELVDKGYEGAWIVRDK